MSEFEDGSEENWPQDWDNEKSKTQVKKELQALRELGKELINLPKRDLDKLDLPEELREAVDDAGAMSKGALKRQTGFIGGLIAELDHVSIERQLNLLKQPHQGQVKQFHQLENWRDRLLAGDDDGTSLETGSRTCAFGTVAKIKQIYIYIYIHAYFYICSVFQHLCIY